MTQHAYDAGPFAEGKPRFQLTKWQRYSLIGAGLAALGVIAGISAAILLPKPVATIPRDIAEKVLFTPYIPGVLPKGYHIADSSFSFVEGALLFQAAGPNGQKLSFSEQARPKDFDFPEFHKSQLIGAKTLQTQPYPTVLGKAPDGSFMGSVVTQDTWVIVTSKQKIDEEHLKLIAKNLVKR